MICARTSWSKTKSVQMAQRSRQNCSPLTQEVLIIGFQSSTEDSGIVYIHRNHNDLSVVSSAIERFVLKPFVDTCFFPLCRVVNGGSPYCSDVSDLHFPDNWHTPSRTAVGEFFSRIILFIRTNNNRALPVTRDRLKHVLSDSLLSSRPDLCDALCTLQSVHDLIMNNNNRQQPMRTMQPSTLRLQTLHYQLECVGPLMDGVYDLCQLGEILRTNKCINK